MEPKTNRSPESVVRVFWDAHKIITSLFEFAVICGMYAMSECLADQINYLKTNGIDAKWGGVLGLRASFSIAKS